MFIAKFFRTKSLVLTGSILLSILFMIVIGVLTVLFHNQQRQSYLDQFEQIGFSFAMQMKANEDLVTTANEKLTNGEGAQDTAFAILKRQLEAMVEGSSIANAYVFVPEQAAADGQSHLNVLQTNQALTDSGLSPGTGYIPSNTFLTGYEKALSDGWAITEPFEDEIGHWISYLAPIKDSNGELLALFGVDFNYGEVEQKLSSIMWRNIGISLLFMAVSLAIVILMISGALKPLRRLAHLSKQAAAGDLTISVPVTSRNEIGQVTESFNLMISNLRQLVHNIKDNSSEVAVSAVNLQESAKQTADATQEIADAIHTVAVGSETQLQSSQECQRAMDEMATGIQRIAESSSIVAELASDTVIQADSGQRVMVSTVVQIQEIERHLVGSVEIIHELKRLSEHIGEIMSLIADVSTQTNLLALNASIEAARAGEHGKGFAVVAQEIRKLAERSRASSEQIEDILQGIGTYTDKAVSSLEQSMADAKAGSEVIAEAGDSFRSIVHSIRQVSGQIQEVSAASEQMSASSEQIAASLQELAQIATVSSQHSERVAASSEEQLAAMEEVASASEQLRDLAAGLNDTIGHFRS